MEFKEDGLVIIHYSNPNIDEVVKSIDYTGSETKNGTITPANYVTFTKHKEQQNRATRENQISTISLFDIDVNCGFDYSNNKFKGIWDMDGKLNEAKASVDLEVGMTAVPKITFLKLGLIGGEFDYGRNYELDFETISLSPLQYCLDAGYYNYASVSAVLLPGSWDKKFTANLMDKENSHIKENSHYEESGFVSECTRKYGALEGTVLKHDGDEYIPLLSAKVTLEKDGQVKYETKTGSKGVFSFAKEIEKGTYDIIVRSNQYETYKGSVKVVGNTNNKIEKPIILEPYAESIVVSGKVYNDKSKEPIDGAIVSVNGYEDRVAITDIDGNYTLQVPIGNQVLNISAKTYGPKTYSGTFTANTSNLDFDLTREYNYEVLEIQAGESYQLDFTAGKQVFVRSDGVAEYSSYLDGDTTYHRRAKDIEFYRGAGVGEHWEIKVFAGSLMRVTFSLLHLILI